MAALKHAKHERFCREWVIDHNGMRAASAAGYAAGRLKQTAYELLQRPDVAARVAELDSKLLAKADITAERVMLELARLAFADVRGLYDEKGELRPVHELDDDTAASIAGIEVDTVTTTSGPAGKKVTRKVLTAKVRRYEKAGALRVLAQHFKIVGNDIDEAVGAAMAVAERMAKAKARLKEMRKKAG